MPTSEEEDVITAHAGALASGALLSIDSSATRVRIWLVEASGGKMSRLTFDAAQEDSQPIWWAGGSRIVVGSPLNSIPCTFCASRTSCTF
jgi:hypothetical protein